MYAVCFFLEYFPYPEWKTVLQQRFCCACDIPHSKPSPTSPASASFVSRVFHSTVYDFSFHILSVYGKIRNRAILPRNSLVQFSFAHRRSDRMCQRQKVLCCVLLVLFPAFRETQEKTVQQYDSISVEPLAVVVRV